MISEELSLLDADIVALLIETAGSDQFADILLAEAQSISGVDEVFGYTAELDGKPQTLISQSSLTGVEGRVKQYIAHYFQDDPALWNPDKPQHGFCRRIRAKEIVRHDYRRICYELPSFFEKLSFGWRDASGLIMISFYHRHHIDDSAAIRLARLAEIALGALNRIRTPLTHDAFIGKLETRLKQTSPELTQRENQVCARTIAGWTSRRISQELDISVATVLTYRQRAYKRLNINAIAELLPDLLH